MFGGGRPGRAVPEGDFLRSPSREADSDPGGADWTDHLFDDGQRRVPEGDFLRSSADRDRLGEQFGPPEDWPDRERAPADDRPAPTADVDGAEAVVEAVERSTSLEAATRPPEASEPTADHGSTPRDPSAALRASMEAARARQAAIAERIAGAADGSDVGAAEDVVAEHVRTAFEKVERTREAVAAARDGTVEIAAVLEDQRDLEAALEDAF